MTQARPFLKFLGGKTALLPELRKHVPADIGSYHEPFVGGGALFFALQPKRAFLFDSNERLIATYRAVRDPNGVEALIYRLGLYAHKHSEAEYYRVRDELNAGHYSNDIGLGAAMIYLNKAGFNGLYRENKSGEFNVPWGKRKEFVVDADNLRACSQALQNAKLDVMDFRKSEALIIGNHLEHGRAVAYFDPPYVPVSASANFTGYTAGGFGPLEQIALRDMAARLRDAGVSVMLSNADLPSVRTLYKGFNLESVQVRRNVNRDGKKRGPVGELIIT